MREVRQADGTIRIVREVKHCSGCGRRFEVGPYYTTSWQNCFCSGDMGGHTVHCCLHPDCRTHTLEPECTGQWGPTADYGQSTHRPSS